MLSYLHSLSATLFFILGSSFFIAYLLMRNDIQPAEAAWWLERGDLALIFASLLYGGVSIYRSLTSDDQFSLFTCIGVLLPTLALLAAAIVLNFWEVLPFEQGEILFR